MFADPNNLFAAAAPQSGSAPSPFQPAPNGAQSGQAPTSPFGVAPSQGRPAPPQPQQAAASPFALVNKLPAPRIAELFEGFAAVDQESAQQAPAPVSMPQPQRGPNGRDTFAAPLPQEGQQRPASDFVLPAERSIPAEVPAIRVDASEQARQASQYAAQPNQSAQPVAVHGEMPQLVLRAIFGVTQELNKNEIIQRARTLPGVRNLHLVGSDEAKAMSFLRASVQRMGFGDQNSMSLHTDAGVIDIIEEPGVTLAVLHEGGYGAGVRETLIIIARELARLV
jgi:hypothetical protein